MRVGLLGGTFDPIHNGHLALAAAAIEQLTLAGVWLVPTGVPWMKRTEPRSAPEHRKTMVELAIAGRPGLHLLTNELDRPGDTYTVDTLDEVCAGPMAADELFFLVGADALGGMHRWKDISRVFEQATVVAVERNGGRPDLAHLDAVVPGASERIVWVAMAPVAISATELRRRAGRGESLRGAAPDAVADYIAAQGLYSGGVWAAQRGERT